MSSLKTGCFRVAFGTIIKSRVLENFKNYRFGYSGKEKDDEVKGGGNSLDFGARIYDPRLGRWLSLDPLQSKYSDLSPYNFVANNPVFYIDPDGKKIIIYGARYGFLGLRRHKYEYTPGQPIPKGADKFSKDTWAAIDAKYKSGENQSLIQLADDKDAKVKVKRTAGSTHYVDITNTVRFNNTEGIVSGQYSNPDRPDDPTTRVVVNPSDPSTRFSPADALEHDLTHGKHDVLDHTRRENARKPANNPAYGDREEELTTQEADDNHGQFRKSDIGVPFKAKNVFDRGTTGGGIKFEPNEAGKPTLIVGDTKHEVDIQGGKAVEIKPEPKPKQ